MTPTDEILYEPAFVARLFDEMARTYGMVNLVSSFGFAALWRKQALRRVTLQPGHTVVDLMTGMGELGPSVGRRVGPTGSLLAVDISPVMCERARQTLTRSRCSATVIEGDVLENSIASSSCDGVVSTFGLKTFSPEQLRKLAREVFRILKPGGVFSFLEISTPPSPLLRWPYHFYINRVIPLIGTIFLGNPENYRMLGVYTRKFGTCDAFRGDLQATGLNVRAESFFFGCATGVTGSKPNG
jgi:demethylmenaquinone methyltransferase/2-methoxy-6-polyprenyl-1,4-benzoquinol methylase